MHRVIVSLIVLFMACGVAEGGRVELRQGVVTLNQLCSPSYIGGDESCGSSVTAYFAVYSTGPGGLRPGCTTSRVDGCEVQECKAGVALDVATTIVTAGKLTVRGREELSLEPRSGLYTSSTSKRLWSAGEPLTVTSTGMDVPAFSAQLPGPDAIGEYVIEVKASELASGTEVEVTD